jgi:L,D-transpeptidase catalytic domain
VLARTTDSAGRTWLQVRLPVRPNGTTGWVPAPALGDLQPLKTWLKIDTHRLTAALIKSGKVVWRARVGVGKSYWPTPKGQFFIRAELKGYGSRGSFYGPPAFITSATSDALTDWPGGGIVGVHGASLPGLIPGAISHGCVRVRKPGHPAAGEADAGGHAADHQLISCAGRKRFAGSWACLTARSLARCEP